MSNNDGDYGRQRHQQQLLRAILKQATSTGVITNPIKLDKVIAAAGKTFTLDLGGIPLVDFIFTLGKIGTGQLTTLSTNAGTFDGNVIGGVSYEDLRPTARRCSRPSTTTRCRRSWAPTRTSSPRPYDGIRSSGDTAGRPP